MLKFKSLLVATYLSNNSFCYYDYMSLSLKIDVMYNIHQLTDTITHQTLNFCCRDYIFLPPKNVTQKIRYPSFFLYSSLFSSLPLLLSLIYLFDALFCSYVCINHSTDSSICNVSLHRLHCSCQSLSPLSL